MEIDGIEVDLNPLGLEISVSSLVASLIFGLIGLYLFRYARRKNSLSLVFVAIVLMCYPLVTSGPWQDWGVGVALCGLAYYLDRQRGA